MIDFNKKETPKEKLYLQGADYLTTEELIAILINTGSKNISAIELSRSILKQIGNEAALANLKTNELVNFKGIGKSKACSILAAIALGKRVFTHSPTQGKPILNAKDIYEYLKPNIYGKSHEYVFVLSLDSRNKLVGCDNISVGTVKEAIVHPREVYNAAIKRHAVSIIIAHNHPSNSPQPSKEDLVITEDIAQAGKMLGIPLIDHVIVCNNDYFSLKQNNMFSTYQLSTKGGDIN